MEFLSGLMESAQGFGGTFASFVVVLAIVVFVHEYGHFWVARRCGVKIESFSIGFGPEIFGWHDKCGTRWRVAWLPLGGYVKMFGDVDPSSFGPSEEGKLMTEDEKKLAFFAQPLLKRFAIVAAGPGANYLFGVVVLAFLLFANGQPYTSTKIAEVMEGSAAAKAGLMQDDQVLTIDSVKMESFEDIKRAISLNTGEEIQVRFIRDDAEREVTVVPEVVETTDRLGGEHKQGRLGIVSKERAFRELGFVGSIRESFVQVYNLTATTLRGVGQMVMGVRSAEELGGPLRIAEMSGKVAQDGVFSFFWFIVVISINLGLINLFPIPLLDGGHLFFYIIEGLRGRPLSERIQEYGARVGAFMVLSLMVFATWNDLVHLHVVSYLTGLFS